jgi:hypothetical protein
MQHSDVGRVSWFVHAWHVWITALMADSFETTTITGLAFVQGVCAGDPASTSMDYKVSRPWIRMIAVAVGHCSAARASRAGQCGCPNHCGWDLSCVLLWGAETSAPPRSTQGPSAHWPPSMLHSLQQPAKSRTFQDQPPPVVPTASAVSCWAVCSACWWDRQRSEQPGLLHLHLS